jgi:hypothetical protein
MVYFIQVPSNPTFWAQVILNGLLIIRGRKKSLEDAATAATIIPSKKEVCCCVG